MKPDNVAGFVARPNIDLDHLARRDARQEILETFRFGARPSAIDDDIAGDSGKAAHVGTVRIAAWIEREAGNTLNDVVRRARCVLGEVSGIITVGLPALGGSGAAGFSRRRRLSGARRTNRGDGCADQQIRNTRQWHWMWLRTVGCHIGRGSSSGHSMA